MNRTIRKASFRTGLVGAISLVSLQAAMAWSDEVKVVDFEIASQPLSKALVDYSEQSHVVIVASADLVDGKTARAVDGEMTTDEAMIALLDGTGLKPDFTEGGAITLAAAETAEKETPPPFQLAQATRIEPGDQSPSGAVDETSNDDSVRALDSIVVTGIRGRPRSVSESPIPIDVFSAEQLEQQPQTGLFESLRFLVPSLNLPQRAGGGTATFIASAGLRGLNPDQTLVLVNGKRRHKTALINTSTGLFSGSAGVDLNMIPSSAISRVEVLRDGAAAQYGSDAIAGVVNIILKDDNQGGRISGSIGQNFDRSDGEFSDFSVNAGLPLGEKGFANLSFEYRDKEFSNRARPVPLPDPDNPAGLNLYPLLPDGGLDPREATINRLVTTNFGNFPQTTFSVGLNAEYDLGEIELYNFTTIADRDSTLDFTFRRPRDSRNIPEIYPDGFRPREVISEEDYEIVTGARGEAVGFDWDFSVGFGRNATEWNNTLGLNTSLGVSSPTSFFLGEINADELTTQFDATRAYDVGDGQLQVSFGLQYREESFEIKRGEPASFADGNTGAAPFAQGFPGFSPEAENDLSRENVNGYLELGWEPTERVFLSGAVRQESFSDSAGDQTVGKLNGRYEFSDSFAIRASISTGFRAPSIQQLGFRGSRGQFADLDNDGVAETIVLRQTLPSTDPAAQALGAEPLTPEESENLSVGFAFTPGNGFTLTVDAYQIDVKDRIALSTQFNRGDGRPSASGGTIGDEISALLDAAGFDQSLGGVNYFTNAIDTRSSGIDVVATWQNDFDFGTIALTGALNVNDDSVESVDPNPEELSGLILADGSPVVQFNRARLGTYTEAIPASKVSLSANYERGGARFSVRGTQFGEVVAVAASEANDTENESQWIVDLEAGYEFDNGFGIFAGSNNVFNSYPEEVRDPNALGTGFYNTISPYGFTGGNWYIRAAYDW